MSETEYVRWLCIVERNSVARKVARAFGYKALPYNKKFVSFPTNDIKIRKYEIEVEGDDELIALTISSSNGLVYKSSADHKYRHQCFGPIDCIEVPIVRETLRGQEKVVDILRGMAAQNTHLLICTNNDDAGEEIAADIRHMCVLENPKLHVYRTTFDTLTTTGVTDGFANMVEFYVDQHVLDAAEYRNHCIQIYISSFGLAMAPLISQALKVNIDWIDMRNMELLFAIVETFEASRSNASNYLWYLTCEYLVSSEL